MKELNMDVETRDKIIFGRYREKKYKYNNVIHFEGLTPGALKELLDNNFIHPEDTEGHSPTVQEIYDFMCQYHDYTCHGYVVGPDRPDYSVHIEGVSKEYQPGTPTECQHFLRLFSDADEIRVDGYTYCWYD